MKIYAIIGSLAAASLTLTSAAFADDATCKDGTTSKGGRGACSSHGGIAKPDKMVGCKDGSMSASGRGACSHHGGVGKETQRAEPVHPRERAETPRTEAPRTEAPRTEAPRTEAPRTEAPRTEAPRSETQRTEPPRSEAGERAEGVDRNASGATARCKDGEYSHALHHTGACSRHGGVAAWLDK